MVRFRLLGMVGLNDPEGRWISIRTAMERGLLTALLLGGPGFVSHQRIITALWDDPPASQLDNVRLYVQRLRGYLKEVGLTDRLVTRRASGRGCGGYSLRVESGELDAALFVDQAETGREKLFSGDHEMATKLLGEALSLWRGDLGEGAPPTAGLSARLTPIRERRLAAIEDYLAACIVRGQTAHVAMEARIHIAAHPMRERAWGLLMVSTFLSGNPAGAADIYREARDALVENAGSEPSAALCALHRAVLACDNEAVRRWVVGPQ